MKTYKASVLIRLKPVVLDPQGKTVLSALHSLGYPDVEDARIGKLVELTVRGDDPESARGQVAGMCERLLANPVIEDYEIEVTES